MLGYADLESKEGYVFAERLGQLGLEDRVRVTQTSLDVTSPLVLDAWLQVQDLADWGLRREVLDVAAAVEDSFGHDLQIRCFFRTLEEQ